MAPDRFCCPACTALTVSPRELACPSCGGHFPIVDGIPDFFAVAGAAEAIDRTRTTEEAAASQLETQVVADHGGRVAADHGAQARRAGDDSQKHGLLLAEN